MGWHHIVKVKNPVGFKIGLILFLALTISAQNQPKGCWWFFPFCRNASQLETLANVSNHEEPRFKRYFIIFTLFNHTHPNGIDLVHYDTDIGKNSLRHMHNSVVMDSEVETKILVEGFKSYSNGPMSNYTIQAYLRANRSNVILADWSQISGTSNFEYPGATKTTAPKLGEAIAWFIISHLMDRQNIRLETVTLVGFSLGAHVAGFAGKKIQRLLNRKLPVIVGLDPAQPAYRTKGRADRLDVDDAEYVEVIHTAAVIVAIYQPIGHSDFYPNYVNSMFYHQPGCVRDWNWKCSHLRAYELFSESLYTEKAFLGYKCRNLEKLNKQDCMKIGNVYMGGESLIGKKVKGIFYVRSCERTPFSNCSLT